MGLPGLHIVETGLARLANLWPVSRGHGSLPDFRAVAVATDAEALARANAIYSGRTMLDAADFEALRWLDSFARSGRQLLMCHALRLLEGWNGQRRAPQPLRAETGVLHTLADAAGAFASALSADLLQPLQSAFVAQHQRVVGLRCHSAEDKLVKALSLLAAGRATRHSHTLCRDALPLLDQALAQLISNDGGPRDGNLRGFMDWTSLLLQADDLAFSLATRTALDRTRPFLAMLLGADQTYCLDDAPVAVVAVSSTAPLRLAPDSQVARITAGKAVVIALPGQMAGATSLHISSHGRRLLDCGRFLHDGTEDQSVTVLSSQAMQQGHLIEQAMGQQRRMIFVSPKGDDIRVEDEVPSDGLTRWLSFNLNREARMSVARQGTQATIALGGRNLWQLTLRGATLLPQRQDNRLIAEAKPTSRARVNWALKRIDRNTAKAEKPDIPELPFNLDIAQRNG